MGQSQEPIEYNPELVQALDNALSSSRMAPYLHKAQGDAVYAYQLYLWNARLAKSFLYPLGIVEVAVRNSMHSALSKKFGSEHWVLNPSQHYNYFNKKTLSSYSASKNRLITAKGGNNISPDEMVAGLNFDFWSNLLRSEYSTLWVQDGALSNAFPLMKPQPDLTQARTKISEINHLRNRIAHHEPIHHLDLHARIKIIEEVMSYICTAATSWMKSCSTARQTLRAAPAKISSLPGVQISSTNIRIPIVVDRNKSVVELISEISNQRPQVALVKKENKEFDVITTPQIMAYLTKVSNENNKAILLEKETVNDVLDSTDTVSIATIDATSTTGDVIAKFFPTKISQNKRPQFLLVMSSGKVVGIIQNPIVKYQ